MKFKVRFCWLIQRKCKEGSCRAVKRLGGSGGRAGCRVPEGGGWEGRARCGAPGRTSCRGVRQSTCAVQLCEKKKREGEGRARPASSGKAQQASRVAPYPAWGGEAEKETTQGHLEMFQQMNHIYKCLTSNIKQGVQKYSSFISMF